MPAALVLVTLLALPVLGSCAESAQENPARAAIAAIRALGGQVQLEGSSVSSVGFRGDANITDAHLVHLKELTSVVKVAIFNSPRVTGTGLVHLKGLRDLQTLYLPGTSVDDSSLAHLGGLTKLVNLYLPATRVTDAGLDHLRTLTNLRILYLDDTAVTDDGVKKLQAALPKCTISRAHSATKAEVAAIIESINSRTFEDLAEYAEAGVLPRHQLAKWRQGTNMKVGKLLGREESGDAMVRYRYELLYDGHAVHELRIEARRAGTGFKVTSIHGFGW